MHRVCRVTKCLLHNSFSIRDQYINCSLIQVQQVKGNVLVRITVQTTRKENHNQYTPHVPTCDAVSTFRRTCCLRNACNASWAWIESHESCVTPRFLGLLFFAAVEVVLKGRRLAVFFSCAVECIVFRAAFLTSLSTSELINCSPREQQSRYSKRTGILQQAKW